MNQYPLWKNLLIVITLIASIFYALPNLYGEDPALQISSSRSAPLDEAAQTRVQEALKRTGIPFGATEKVANGVLIRFNDTGSQLKAKDLMSEALGNGYVVALNLAPKTPGWLTALGAADLSVTIDDSGALPYTLMARMEAAVYRLRPQTGLTVLPELFPGYPNR